MMAKLFLDSLGLGTARREYSSAAEHALHPKLPVPCNPALLTLACARRVLLLQGPVGPFFDRLTGWLRAQGAEVHRVAFQPGDVHDSRALRPIRYTGDAHAWPEFLRKLLVRRDIDAVVLFGQAREHHQAALELAKAMGVAAIVLEEGYVRPGYVTMELGGVNGLSDTMDRYHYEPEAPGFAVEVHRAPRNDRQFWQMAGHACRHYWAQYWHKPLSVEYRHHKSTDIWEYSRYWVRSAVRKQLHKRPDAATVHRLRGAKYFFVPLQHDGDAQITHHSPYRDTAAFVREVLHSFALHAPEDARLVFRLHPHSRGGPGHHKLLRRLTRELAITDRVVYLVEGHTPTLVQHAMGVVLINSTVGLQALMRGKPMAVLGDALYKRPGLYFQGELHDFWTSSAAPNEEATREFLEQLIGLTQAPCNVYAPADEALPWTTRTGPPVGKA
jgi:capsular polysaccharide export protein